MRLVLHQHIFQTLASESRLIEAYHFQTNANIINNTEVNINKTCKASYYP